MEYLPAADLNCYKMQFYETGFWSSTESQLLLQTGNLNGRLYNIVMIFAIR